MPTIPRQTLPVCEIDVANLRASGLTDETIRANGLYTDGDGLAFPYRGIDGTVNCYARKRLHVPIGDMKYWQPKGSPKRVYLPVESLEKLNDGHSAIFVVEGEKKALAMAQLGLAAVGISGIWLWAKTSTKELIDDLQAIACNSRTFYIVFDYDEKPKARHHSDLSRRQLARALRKAGEKEVMAVDIPPGPNGAKQGADDFIVAHDAAAFLKLIEAAQPVPADDYPPLSDVAGRTETTNAARLVAKFKDDIRWVGHWDKWLIWDGKRWAVDRALRIEAFAKEIASGLFKEIGDAFRKGNVDKDTVGAMYSFAKASNSNNGIKNMVALARSEPDVPFDIEHLDADPFLLNVENGTIDLRTGKLREHRREDFITKLAPVMFDPAAYCPTWDAFLNTIFAGNADLISYMQRLVGYTLTGSTEEHVLPFCHGTGANGKSTKVETLLKLLGPDYAMKAAPDLLMAKKGESHPTDRADLFGKRFVACVETEEGRRMAEALVKELTGGDRIRARRMREDFWEFAPTHHVWLISNHKPAVRGTDHGIWRRIKLIPFDVVISEAQQDKRLPAKLAAELPGILNWAIAGCLEWQKDGMREPKIVQAATGEYEHEMDEVGLFIDGCCQVGENFKVSAKELYEAFRKEFPDGISQKLFGGRLTQKGFKRGRVLTSRGWEGLRLKDESLMRAFGGQQ